MAEQQLQIYNPNNGEWREVKGITSVLPAGEGFDYIRGDGAAFSSAYSKSDYPLTPIDPPIWATLGKNALATVPEEERENVTGEFRKPSAERGLTPDNIAPCYYGDHVTHIGPRIILRTPTPPKTDREILQEIANLPACPARTMAQKHLESE